MKNEESKLKKWKVSITTVAFKEIEAESLVEAGDKMAQWADENRYDLWHFLSKNAAVTTGESIEEYKDEKTSDADV
tara:strand:- start:1263 stop:1490 length:228 start_codon:yes stop_codon:yes gene_type:complete